MVVMRHENDRLDTVTVHHDGIRYHQTRSADTFPIDVGKGNVITDAHDAVMQLATQGYKISAW